jgi:hypothetical protein
MTTKKINIVSDPLSGLLPDPLVAERYKVTPRTIYRWDRQPDLDFPRPIFINRRKYRRVNQLENWERQHVAEKVGYWRK